MFIVVCLFSAYVGLKVSARTVIFCSRYRNLANYFMQRYAQLQIDVQGDLEKLKVGIMCAFTHSVGYS